VSVLVRRLEAVLEQERERWVLWLPIGLGLGISVYFSLPVEPPLWLGLGLAAATLILGLAGRSRQAALMTLIGLGAVSLGFAAAQWRTALAAAPVLTERMGPTGVSGRVVLVENYPDGDRITLDLLRITGLGPDRTPDMVRLGLRGNQPHLSPGDWIRVRGMLSPPSPPAAPGAFDFQRQSYFQRLGGVGFAMGRAELIAKAPENGLDGAWLIIERLRQHISDKVIAALPGSRGAVALSLMNGDRSAISLSLMEDVRDSGLAHLLSISGLHIGLVAGILFGVVRGGLALAPFIALRYPIKKWAAGVAVIGALAYSLVAGATVPTMRSFLMISIVMMAVMLDRRGISMRVVAWAAVVIMLIQPETMLGAGFQMSFAAVVALIAFYEFVIDRRRGREQPPPVWWRYPLLGIGGIAITTLIAGAATAPFALYHFNYFQAYGLAANLIAVPATSVWVMPWAIVAFVLMPLGLESLALTPMGWGVEVIIQVASGVSSWPGAVSVLPSMPSYGLAAVVLGGAWLCIWRLKWRLWGCLGVVAGVATIFFVRPPDIMIDERGKLLAVRAAKGGLALSSTKAGGIIRQTWLRRAGQVETSFPWPRSGVGVDGRLSCDFMGCIYRKGKHVVALVAHAGALTEDCRVADVVVSAEPVRISCPSAHTVIDRFDLWRNGGYALWLDEDGVRFQSVNGVRGKRPWVVRPEKKKKEEKEKEGGL